MKIKTSELSGVSLDWAVAQAVDFPVQYSKRLGLHVARTMSVSAESNFIRMGSRYCPSTDWSQGGQLIDQFGVTVMKYDDSCLDADKANLWTAQLDGAGINGWSDDSPSALIAACRAIVAAKLGDEVDVPEGLV